MKKTSGCFVVSALGLACLVCLCLIALGVGINYLITIPTSTSLPAEGFLGRTQTALEEGATPMSLAISDPVSADAVESEGTLERAEVPQDDPILLAEELKGMHDVPRIAADHADPIPLGTVRVFHASNNDTETNFDLRAHLVYATPHVYFWVDENANAADKDVRQLSDLFENQIYPTDRKFFGSEWTPGVDGDPHIYILYASRLGSSVGGYYSSSDEYMSVLNRYSNEHEMFYINADAQELNDTFTAGVLAHEFQHMIHWNQDRNEDTWLNEGSSELAVALNHFDLGGFDQIYVSNPDIPLTNWPSISKVDTSPWYGGAFLFMDYFLGRFGTPATQALIHNPDNGMHSVDTTLQQLNATDPLTNTPLTADRFMADLASSLLINDSHVYQGAYSFRQYQDVPLVSPGRYQISTCPSRPQSGRINQYGIRYIRIRCQGDFTLHFAGQSTQKVVPVDAPQGQYMVWSNRGDESDMTLTRAFDLPNGPATLKYSVWYDVEDGWDYGYAEISDNGGQTWKTLSTPSGTGENPQGNNYGWGWTGESGGGKTPQWLDESVDLSAYAGKSVQVRFEYITDAAVNYEGIMLDDIRIPEINYEADFEDGLDGWDAKGFARLENIMPQTFQVVLVKQADSANTLERLDLDNRQYGSRSFHLGNHESLVVVIVPTARFTSQEANYQFEVVSGQ